MVEQKHSVDVGRNRAPGEKTITGWRNARTFARVALIVLTSVPLWVLAGCESYSGGPGDSDPQEPSPTAIAAVDAQLKQLEWSNIAFNAPERVQLGEEITVELLLSPKSSIKDLQRQLSGVGKREGARIRASNRMEAILSGPAFEITPTTPQTQAVSSQHTTRWMWRVEPTEPGEQTLHLRVYAQVDINGQGVPTEVKTFDRAIEVNVTMGQRVRMFMQEHWEWLVATIVLPLAGIGWRRFRNKGEGGDRARQKAKGEGADKGDPAKPPDLPD